LAYFSAELPNELNKTPWIYCGMWATHYFKIYRNIISSAQNNEATLI